MPAPAHTTTHPRPRLTRADKGALILCAWVYGTLFGTHAAGVPWAPAAGLAALAWVVVGVYVSRRRG